MTWGKCWYMWYGDGIGFGGISWTSCSYRDEMSRQLSEGGLPNCRDKVEIQPELIQYVGDKSEFKEPWAGDFESLLKFNDFYCISRPILGYLLLTHIQMIQDGFVCVPDSMTLKLRYTTLEAIVCPWNVHENSTSCFENDWPQKVTQKERTVILFYN